MAFLSLRLGTLDVAPCRTDWQVTVLNITQKLLTYHCVLFLASAVNSTPSQPPYK